MASAYRFQPRAEGPLDGNLEVDQIQRAMRRTEMLREASALLTNPATMSDGALLKSIALTGSGSARVRDALAPLAGFVADVDPAALAAMPEGSFGRAVHAFCVRNGIELLRPTMTARLRVLAEEHVLPVRYAATHDLVHVLVDEGADYAGEAAVYGFACGQGLSATYWLALFTACVFWPLMRPLQALAIWRGALRGLRKGRAAPLLLAARFEDRLAEPLLDVRRSLGLA
jgi:ubiquinone biosynthesis protein Coq4